MGRYKIEVKRSAEKELSKIPKKNLLKVLAKIESLSTNPYPIKSIKLTNKKKHRIRVGNYRILYSVEDDILTIFVVKVGHRKGVYR